MLDDRRFEIEGLALPKGGCVKDQTFADDIALYLRGSRANMDKTQRVLDLFCKASGEKVNWNKLAAIWASRKRKEWDWGQEVGL